MPLANAKKNLIEEFKLPEEVAASMCDAIPERYSFVLLSSFHNTPLFTRGSAAGGPI